jgi:hypothetical protein
MDRLQPDKLGIRINEVDRWYHYWLAAPTNPRHLRSPDLTTQTSRPFHAPLCDRTGIVDLVCAQRVDLLGSVHQLPTGVLHKSAGKLLLYDPDLNLFCGAAERETDGFFDVDNVPPPDFWVGYLMEKKPRWGYGAFLVSWIPTALLDLVERGIRVNPEECISWADDVRPKVLRRMGW